MCIRDSVEPNHQTVVDGEDYIKSMAVVECYNNEKEEGEKK